MKGIIQKTRPGDKPRMLLVDSGGSQSEIILDCLVIEVGDCETIELEPWKLGRYYLLAHKAKHLLEMFSDPERFCEDNIISTLQKK